MNIGKHLLQYEPVIIDEKDKETFFPLDKDQWEPHNQYVREIQIFADKLLHDRPSDTPAEYALRLEEILSIQYFSKLMKRQVTMEEMDAWADEIPLIAMKNKELSTTSPRNSLGLLIYCKHFSIKITFFLFFLL